MIAIVLSALLTAATGPAPSSDTAPLQCDMGPVAESVGGNAWTVYACHDGKSVVVLAAPPNPASPFVFFLTPDGDGVTLHGEGDGPVSATGPAFAQLKSMSAKDLAALHLKARSAK